MVLCEKQANGVRGGRNGLVGRKFTKCRIVWISFLGCGCCGLLGVFLGGVEGSGDRRCIAMFIFVAPLVQMCTFLHFATRHCIAPSRLYAHATKNS